MSAATSDGLTIRVQGGDSAGSAQPQGWPALRRQPCPAELFGSRGVASIGLQAYYAESWFTASGARLKARRLQQAGLPNMANWRFITLTVASRTISPFEAYNRGKQRMRRFFARFRKAIGRSFMWCWKLEFHDDGYPHWHVPLEYLKAIPADMFEEIENWWGLGRIKIQRIRGRDIRYVFKYVAKGSDDLPDWVLNYKGRIRVFQTSAGFYTKRQPKKRAKTEPMSCLVPVSLRTRLHWDERKALLMEDRVDGSRRVAVVKLRMTFNALLMAKVHQAVARRIPLVAPGVVGLSYLQSEELRYQHRRFAGLATIPRDAEH